MDHFVNNPLGILEDVPIKMGEFYVPVFIIFDMAKDAPYKSLLGGIPWPLRNVKLM